jgi:uncharacterized delta-60 repeat protein
MLKFLTPLTCSAAVIVSIVVLLAVSAVAQAAPGDLDPSFDGDGKTTIDYGGDDAANAVVVQPDGKIVLVGSGNATVDFVIARLNPDGSFDTSFDGDGTVGIDFGGADFAQAVALAPDGKIVVAGGTSVNFAMAVARLNTDGSLDASFDPGGTDGPGKRTFGGEDANAVLVAPDGKIVLAGSGGPKIDFEVVRLNPDGSFDTSFDGDGTLGIDFGSKDHGRGAALQPDGRVVVAGQTLDNLGVAVARSNPDGSLDDTFAGTGKKTFGYGGSDSAKAVALQPDGRIVVAGYQGLNTAFAVTRLNPDGSFDPGFDGDGTASIDFGGNDGAGAVALVPNGKIVVAGIGMGGFGTGAFAVARLQPGGAPDTTFSFDGKTTVDYGGFDYASAVALAPDGRIVVAGRTSVNRDVAVARLQGDPPAAMRGGPGAGGPGAGGPGAGVSGSGRGAGARTVPRCAGRRATIVGTAGRDVLRGTRRADVIVALGGSDVVRAAQGNDVVCGGPGNDRVTGGPGGDRLAGESGRDRLLGGPGNDRLTGGGGRDTCLGGSGRDRATCETKRSA